MARHINNRSDFAIQINTIGVDGQPMNIPDYPFRMIFSTTGGGVTYEVRSDDEVHCRQISNSTLIISFDFSDHPYFRNGELICTFAMSVPNGFYKDKLLDTRHPHKTGYFIWDGDTDACGSMTFDYVLEYVYISAYELAKEAGYKGTREEYITLLYTLDESERARAAAETKRTDDEQKRIAAEEARITAENSRITNEHQRVQAELARITAENNRIKAEARRAEAEQTRIDSESARVATEQVRVTTEQNRESAETKRVQAEQSRVFAENSRVSAEEKRVSAEIVRVEQEQVRVNAELERDKAEQERVEAEAERKQYMDLYAKVDGEYDQMIVGTAKTLQGSMDLPDSSVIRTSGGSNDIATGYALINGIKGNSIVLNQLIKNGNFTSLDEWIVPEEYAGNGTATVASNKLTLKKAAATNTYECYQNVQVKKGHKYLLIGTVVRGSISFDNVTVQGSTASSTLKFLTTANADATVVKFIPDATANNNTFSYVMLFDLTLTFGAGNEPYDYEDFVIRWQDLFGVTFPTTVYREYDEGTVLNALATEFKTVGFNQYNNGKAFVIAGNEYQIVGPYTKLTLNGATITPDSNKKFTPATTGTLTVTGGNATTCIHLVWSGIKDGQYENYWTETRSIPAFTGKLNGEGESIEIFPQGMCGFGNTRDEIKVEDGVVKAIKRVESVSVVDYEVVVATTEKEYVVDNFILPMQYRVDDFGTEQMSVPEGYIAPTFEILYNLNAADTIRRLPQNYISGDSMDEFLKTLNETERTTISKRFDADKNAWVFDANGQRFPALFIGLWDKACGIWGKYNKETGYFELNGLTDITYEQALDIYNAGAIHSSDCSYFYRSRSNIRTNLPRTLTSVSAQSWPVLTIFNLPYAEVLNVSQANDNDPKGLPSSNPSTDSYAFYAKKCIRVIGVINLDYVTVVMQGTSAINLKSVKFSNLKVSFGFFSTCKEIDYESIKYLIDNAANTKEITITLHSNTYAALTGEAESYPFNGGTQEQWQQLLIDATERNITFATV